MKEMSIKLLWCLFANRPLLFNQSSGPSSLFVSIGLFNWTSLDFFQVDWRVKQRYTHYFLTKPPKQYLILRRNFLLPLHSVGCLFRNPYLLNWAIKMGVPPVLALLLLFHLLFLHHSSGKCPDSFDCGTHGRIRYPLSNSTFPNCGLYTVQNCTDPVPKLDLGKKEAVLYELKTTNVTENSIRVKDPNLGYLIGTKACDVFGFYLNWTLPPKLTGISFTIPPGLTLFRCTTISPELDKKQHEYFRGNDSYRGCSGYTVYYKYPYHSSVSSNASVGLNCSVIELPRVSKLRSKNASDVFSVLASVFDIRFHVSKECQECRNKGGRCSRDSTRFRCRNEKKGISKYLVLGTVIPGVLILLLCLVIIIWRRNKWNHVSSYISSKNSSSDHLSKADLEGGSAYFGASVFSYAELEQATDDFDPSKELGDGGFGTVYHGKKGGCLDYHLQPIKHRHS